MTDIGTIEKIGSQVSMETPTTVENLLPSTSVDPSETQSPDETSETTVSVVPPATVQEQPSSEQAFSPIIGYPPMTNLANLNTLQVQAIINKVKGLPVED